MKKIPVWIYVGGGLVLVYVLYRKATGSAGSAGGSSATGTPSGTTDQGTGTGGENIFFLPNDAGQLDNGGSSVTVGMNRNPGNGGTTGEFHGQPIVGSGPFRARG